MKKSVLFGLALGISSIALSGCGGETSQEAAVAPDGVPGLSATNARMVLAPVAGNPAAVYFDLAYDGDRNLALSGAAVEGAESAMIHEMSEWEGKMQMAEALPIVLKKGDKLTFAPGGKHVMAMNVSPEMMPGGTTEVTLIVSGGDKLSFPAEIRAAGEDR